MKQHPSVPSVVPIDYVTFRLDVISNAAKADASPVYEAACGVSLRELRCLRIAAFEPGLSQNRLASLAFIEKTLVSKAITGLVRRKLLKRKTDAGDARRIRLFATQAGLTIVETCERIGRSLEAELMAGITKKQREAFDQCLEKMMSNIANMVKERGTFPELRFDSAR
jgi:DNA-binding MarR family transcriptional regulator